MASVCCSRLCASISRMPAKVHLWGPVRMNPNYLIALLVLSGLLVITAGSIRTTEATQSFAPRSLYAVNESSKDRGSISVYDIDAGHRLIKTVQTVPGVGDVRGVAVSAVTGKLYAAYRDFSGTGMVYCLNVTATRSSGIERSALVSIGWRSIRTASYSTFRHGRAVLPTISTFWMPISAMLFERCISPIDHTTRSIRYLGRFSKRRRPRTEAAITCI
jgi:hypothetical protein